MSEELAPTTSYGMIYGPDASIAVSSVQFKYCTRCSRALFSRWSRVAQRLQSCEPRANNASVAFTRAQILAEERHYVVLERSATALVYVPL
jgi:hypothetical protein